MDGYEELANAIVAQAGWDYLEALGVIRGCPDERAERIARKEAAEIEAFLHSAWFGMLTKADPDYLIEKMREAAEE